MAITKLAIRGESFEINGKPTYAEIKDGNSPAQGLLMNARFIQGVFDDKQNPQRYVRWGNEVWDPEQHTDDLIAALPEWYRYGLRAFTVGFQGGGPCFTINNRDIDNNPFGSDGKSLDPAYADRMNRLIRAADEIGMVVIVSYFYGDQARRLQDGRAVRDAVATASHFLRDGGYTNVIIEIANEYDIAPFAEHPLLYYPQGIASLIDQARALSGGLPVGCSGKGGSINREISEASDVILIHGNGCTRQRLYNMIQEVRGWALNRPIVCNEDSQAIGQLDVAYRTGTSWGYYNNMTKQEPPANWSVTPGEDLFFALRMAAGIGIDVPVLSTQDSYYLQGLEPQMEYAGQRWIRLASLYPEAINYVEFLRNGILYYVAYDEPFSVHFASNWRQGGVLSRPDDREWTALVHLHSGDVLEKSVVLDG